MPKKLPKTDFRRVLSALTGGEIDFIVIGGLAAIMHGVGRTTYDVDVVYARTPANMQRIVNALAPFEPYLRGAEPGLPFKFDERTLRNGLNFMLLTSIGGIDLLGDVVGGGNYENLLRFATRVSGFGAEFLTVNLDKLIELKRAAGRSKDTEAIAELEAIRQERVASGRE
jgi:predicted nucleotidyltransferase